MYYGVLLVSTKWSNPKKRGEAINNILTSIGTLLLVIWLITIFLEVDPNLFLIIGATSLILTIISRFYIRRSMDIGIGGGVTGFLFVWLIVWFFYSQKSEGIELMGQELEVSEILIVFLFIIILAWFLIPEKTPVQELVFGLSPLMSALILNIWKIGVLIQLLTFFEEFEYLEPIANPLFLGLGIFDIALLFTKQIKLNYADLILDPLQLLGTLYSGPIQAVKWVLLTTIFVTLDEIALEWGWGSGGLVIFAVFFALTNFSTSLTRTFLSSGIIETKAEEAKVIVPKVFNEIQQLTEEDFKEFYEVQKPVKIRQERAILTFHQGDILLRLPLSDSLEEQAGVFLTQIFVRTLKPTEAATIAINVSLKAAEDAKKGKKRRKERKRYTNRKIKTYRVPKDEWEQIQDSVTLLELDMAASKLGFKSPDELDKNMQKFVRKSVEVQEQVRSRLRGVPVPTKYETYDITIQDDSLLLPRELLDVKNIEEGQEIELIPGKGEYLFYARIKKKKE